MAAAAVAAVSVTVVAAIVLLGPKSAQPPAFPTYGPYGSVARTSAKVGETYYAMVTLTDPSPTNPGWITLHGVAPHGLTDTAAATFSYVLCTVKPPQPIGVGTTHDLRHDCTSVMAADDARMVLRRQQLWVAVTPHATGVVTFHGVDLHYTRDGHDVSEHLGPDVRIPVT